MKAIKAASIKLPKQSGFSLAELMIAMVVGLLLLTGLINVVVNTGATHNEMAKVGRSLENGRFSTSILSDEIQHAGYYGRYDDYGTVPASLVDPCSVVAATIATGIPLPIQGYNSPSTSPISCLDSADHKDNTDILVIRRAATEVTAIGSVDATEIYIQSTPSSNVVDTGANVANFTLVKRDLSLEDLRKLRVDIYFVSPCDEFASGQTKCTSGADDGNPIPTLKRLELTSSGGATAIVMRSLVKGVENLQIDYGIDRSGDGAPNRTTTGGTDDSYVVAPANATDWSNVVAARINLLIRDIETSAGHTDSKTYNLGLAGTTSAFSDNYKRHVYTTVVRAVNVSERREAP